MGGAKRPESISEVAKWKVFYAPLVKLLKNQQEQIETLLSQRKSLEEWIKKHQEARTANHRLYETHISELMSRLEEKEMELLMEAAKTELMVGLKHREAVVRKLKLEETEDELADFRALFDLLTASSKKVSNMLFDLLTAGSKETDEPDQGTESRRRTRSSTSKIAAADPESERLKLKYEKLVSDKNVVIAMLSKEKTFIWNQFNMLESKLTEKLKVKQAEVDQANDKLVQVVTTAEQLQSSNGEKDGTIAELREQLQSSNTEKDEAIEKLEARVHELSQELEGLKKSQVATPALRSCKGMAVKTVKKESNAENGSRSSKRKGDDDDAVIIVESPPNLFTSSFRVPKLKNSSTPA
ncbi:unnamed protein product [Linum tenue]|uniref:Uncharacterized protein n=1 Tax=Linum tenue TaxID=586396 RepID=A0AAV0LNC5_9ROSI|nr:unnamed protein product [Linum tenue]